MKLPKSTLINIACIALAGGLIYCYTSRKKKPEPKKLVADNAGVPSLATPTFVASNSNTPANVQTFTKGNGSPKGSSRLN